MSTTVWVMNFGELSKELRGQLRDASGAVDLDDFASVNVRVMRTRGGTALVDVACVPDADQTVETGDTGKGWLTFTTEATAALLAVNSTGYFANFKAMDGATPRYFPLNRRLEQTYLKFVVQPI